MYDEIRYAGRGRSMNDKHQGCELTELYLDEGIDGE